MFDHLELIAAWHRWCLFRGNSNKPSAHFYPCHGSSVSLALRVSGKSQFWRGGFLCSLAWWSTQPGHLRSNGRDAGVGKAKSSFRSAELSRNKGLSWNSCKASNKFSCWCEANGAGSWEAKRWAKLPLSVEGNREKGQEGLTYLLIMSQTPLPEISHHPETHPGADQGSPWKGVWEKGREEQKVSFKERVTAHPFLLKLYQSVQAKTFLSPQF